ncbi:MAG: saccharopine dehydrogenase family protein [Solirubrobacterales bacterium]
MAGDSHEQTGPIAVYGATGYTGRLVAAELRRRGADLVLAGRSAAKLEIVAEDIGGAPTRAAALDDPGALRDLLADCAAVIACAGPFRLHGEPVVRVAVETATHYLDTTGEQPFIREVFERHGPDGERAGTALVPAMGFDYVPGDMIAALAAEGMGPLDEVALAYAVRFGPSRGTAVTGIGMMSSGGVEWREGRLEPASRGLSRGTWEFPEPVGRQRMIRYPAGEQIMVPRHVRTRSVRTMLTAATVAPHRWASAAVPLAAVPLGLALRTPARRLVEVVARRLPEGPGTEARRKARWTIACEAVRGEQRRSALISGPDVYGLTARTTVEGALRCAAPGYEGSGALAPSQAFDAGDFLDSLSSFGVTYEVDPLPPR